ncbi:MAG: 2-hydroxyacid dehydrogenase [Burkholderiaceae bacterium]
MSQSSEVLLLSPLYAPTQQALESNHQCLRIWEQADRQAFLASIADRIEAVATHSGVGIDRATVEALPKLKIVANFGVGIDTTDLPACTEHGVTVCNTPDVLTEDVADMALGLLLAAVRQIPQGDRYIRDGLWREHGEMHLTQTLQGRKVGVVGMGRIGQAIARRCAAFNTEVAYFGPRRKAEVAYQYFDDVTALAQWANVIIAACPGGPATRKIVSAQALSALGPEGVFVNIARGSVVDQDALIELLDSRSLASAGLDVFNDEPNVPQALIDMPHVVLQPHQGSASTSTRMAMGQLVVDNLRAYFAGKPLLTPVAV